MCVCVPGRRAAAVCAGGLSGGRLHDGRAGGGHQAPLEGRGGPGLLQPLTGVPAQRLRSIVSHTRAHIRPLACIHTYILYGHAVYKYAYTQTHRPAFYPDSFPMKGMNTALLFDRLFMEQVDPPAAAASIREIPCQTHQVPPQVACPGLPTSMSTPPPPPSALHLNLE